MPPSNPQTIDVDYTSYSRLECYSQCPAKYKNRYVDKVPVDKSLQMALLRGTLVHACLEDYNSSDHRDEKEKFDIFLSRLEEWLLDDIKIECSLNELTDIAKFAKKYGEVITRGTVRGAPGTRILNSDGSIPKDLESFPPRTFTKVLQELNLSSSILYWNNWAASRKDEFWRDSFSFLVAECYSMFESFKWAEWIGNSVVTEFPVSTDDSNLVLFSDIDRDPTYLRAYIDWIALTKSGQTVFIDYKTGKTKPSANDVLHHPQLNLYCKASLTLFGSIPDYICIYHARTGEYITAVPDISIINSIYNLFLDFQEKISSGCFPKSHPGLFGSSCKSYQYKTKQYEYCEYIDVCWPIFNQTLEIDV